MSNEIQRAKQDFLAFCEESMEGGQSFYQTQIDALVQAHGERLQAIVELSFPFRPKSRHPSFLILQKRYLSYRRPMPEEDELRLAIRNLLPIGGRPNHTLKGFHLIWSSEEALLTAAQSALPRFEEVAAFVLPMKLRYSDGEDTGHRLARLQTEVLFSLSTYVLASCPQDMTLSVFAQELLSFALSLFQDKNALQEERTKQLDKHQRYLDTLCQFLLQSLAQSEERLFLDEHKVYHQQQPQRQRLLLQYYTAFQKKNARLRLKMPFQQLR